MRILQLHTRYRQSGGEDSAVRAQADLLRSGGHEVVEHHVQNPDGNRAAALALLRAPWNARAAAEVASLVETARPDVVHLHNWWYAMSPAVVDAVADLGVPLVSTLHNFRLHCANAWTFRDGGPCTDCFGGSMLPGVRHACYQDSRVASAAVAGTVMFHRRRSTWDRVSRLVTPSSFAQDLFASAGTTGVEVLPNPVPDPGERSALPSASDDVVVVARLSSEKGVEVVLDAWRRAAVPGLRLVVIGDGPERASLEARAGQGVEFVGRVPSDQVRSRLLGARAALVPTLTLETFGLGAVEAMAAGTGPVVPALGALPEVVEEGGGWVVGVPGRPATVREWVPAIEALADDAAVDRAGEVARSAWASRFSPDVVLARTEDLYARIAGRP